MSILTDPPVSALNSFPKIHTGSEVSGKSSNSPNRSVSYVNVAVKEKPTNRSIHIVPPYLAREQQKMVDNTKQVRDQETSNNASLFGLMSLMDGWLLSRAVTSGSPT